MHFVGLNDQWIQERDELLPIIERVFASGTFVGGEEVELFETELKTALGVKHVVALNSGTDALVYGLAAAGIGSGDEVITQANSFVAPVAAIVFLGARPVFVDVKLDQNIDVEKIESNITPRTKAILPVHLAGRMADMPAIQALSDRHGLLLVEDAAQAIGSRYNDKLSGTWGTLGCFSAHPLKNLNACGDAGFITTNDSKIASEIRLMRNHGLKSRHEVVTFGRVSRMDAIQAAILRFRLQSLSKVFERRRENVGTYRLLLDNKEVVHVPDRPEEFNTWSRFVIQVDRRDKLKEYLRSKGIVTGIHYPIPLHLQPAASQLSYKVGDLPVTEFQANRILSLPVHQYLDKEKITYVAESINEFYSTNSII